MPTECERSVTSSVTTKISSSNEIKDNNSTITTTTTTTTSSISFNEDLQTTSAMMEGGGDMSTSQTSTTSNGSSSCNGGGRKTSITSPDPTAYVAKARVTRPTPPPPPYNPMQFVQIKPCNLYQTAQEQLKKAEEVKKIKEIRKEEPEDWQNNLDNWKSSRRKRVEHIIDRVVEVKKLELEEHDRTRRKSKTFSEMIEERGERAGGRGLNKLVSLAVYAEDESNDLSDLGIGTSSASGKSSLSEDYDNNSVMSDNAAELDKAITNSTHHKPATDSTTREYISSPGYETSSSTAPASSPDPCEYTYEGAIQDYKQRVSRAASGLTTVALNKLTQQHNQTQQNSKESTPERGASAYPPRRGSKIEDRLMGFEVQSPSSEECIEKSKVDVPKIDISKRKEIFEQQKQQQQQQQQLQQQQPALQTNEPKSSQSLGNQTNTVVPRVALRDRFKVQQQDTHTETSVTQQPKKELKRLSGDITSIKERLQSLEQQQNLVNSANGAIKATANKLVDIPVPPLKERLSSLQNAVTKEEIRKPPVVLIDARQLEIMKVEEEKAQQSLKETKQKEMEKEKQSETQPQPEEAATTTQLQKETKIVTEEQEENDRDDSGIHTADDVELEEQQQRLQADQMMKKEQELKLNAAIEALAKEEQQLSEAANVVNQIEAEFEELTLASVATLPPLAGAANTIASSSSASASASASATPITNDHMEYSVSSTNPLATKSISSSSSSSSSPTTSLNHNENSCSPSSLISDNNGTGSVTGTGTEPPGKGNNNDNEVKVLDIKSGSAATNLRRKPTNEMVHAKNLLKIFKETFQNDLDLDLEEQEQLENYETKAVVSDNNACDDKLGLNIKTQIYENSNRNPKEIETPPSKEQATTPQSPKLSNIPRTMTPLLVRKPPMSPQLSRSAVRLVNHTPPGSPALARKNDSQFSINGRVEIFNSKTMTSPIKSPVPHTPTSPTVTAKRAQMPHIKQPAVATTAANNILLPQTDNITAIKQQQQQITTVIEPLATLKQQQQQQMKSMPAQRMVNEPKTTAMVDDCEQTQAVKHQQQQFHQANHVDDDNGDDDDDDDKELVKQQQQQQQHQPEVVVCAPPITIVNPDELPKPNTVKNLSSCFQQKDHNASSSNSASKPIVPPKPLPRSRIPQATPPQSPLLPRRHICYSSSASLNEEQNPASTTPSVEDNKKLSLISCSSNSSSSTDTTVIENDKKLSILSQISTSSSSGDSNPTLVKTNAQIHQEPKEKEQEPEQIEKANPPKEIVGKVDTPKENVDEPDCMPAKTLDKLATQALVEEMIKDETKNRALALNTKYKAPLAPLKPNAESPIDEQQTPIAAASANESPNEEVCTPKTPVKTPTSPVFSNKTELFKTTKPLVVSTLYDKYQQEDPVPLAVPNNQRPIDKSSSKPKPVEPLPLPLIIPAELPNLPDCPPNESTLYKLANSAPHSPASPRSNKSDNSLQNPSSPSTNSEKNLAIDSAICNSLLASLAATPDMMPLQRQHTVEEDLCQKVDKDTLPFHQGSTGFKDVTKSDIKRCDGLTPSSASKLHGVATQRQKTVEEELCQKLDVHSLPDGKQQPKTGFKCVSPTEIRKCDNFFGLGAAKPNSKPSSPIMQARAAHSKALIETCEKIIAEEKQANNQLKSSLPASPVGTPVIQRKSKIPLPISSCLSCKATESLNEADLRQQNKEPSSPSSSCSPTKEENNGVIARMHVVETQIKVTTTTPPASPKITAKTQVSPQTQSKKTKNIFDFLKKNFGGSSPNQKEDHTEATKANANSETNALAESPKVLVLSEQELQDLEKVKYDEIHKFDNSKFYLPSHDIVGEEEEDGLTATPPPLPKTPAPVNIEITRKIITDEILEDDKTEQQLTQEIDDLLDDELNKLNYEIEELEKAGQKQ